MMNNESRKLVYQDSAHISHEVTISPDLFTFQQADKKIHDVSFSGKPTTFFHDALKRFAKNKSSLVAAAIIGVILALCFILPPALPMFSNTNPNSYEQYLSPKLFPAGTGFWDGTEKVDEILYNPETGEIMNDSYEERAIVDGTFKTYTGSYNAATELGKGGYVRMIATPTSPVSNLTSPTFAVSASDSLDLSFSVEMGLEEIYGSTTYDVVLVYNDENGAEQTLPLLSNLSVTGESVFSTTDGTLTNPLASAGIESLPEARLRFVLDAAEQSQVSLYLENVGFQVRGQETAASFDDANRAILDKTYTSTNTISAYGVEVTYCSFTYDPYVEVYGEQTATIGKTQLDRWIAAGYCTYDFNVGPSSFTILDDRCPLRTVEKQNYITGIVNVQEVVGTVSMYRYYGYSSMPIHLFGTDNTGKDMLKYVFEGTRNSLGIAILISAICFLFGLLYGSIEGYFGGNIDLFLERVVDLLGNIPSIVIITICVLHLGQNFGVFILAMCLTGWIGTSSLTRTQFYRFKRREYVLASRTLGANDGRLIFKHILPNAMGTIITSSVLIIPSVIFSEATISYLGIGLAGLPSLGTILSNNQTYLSTFPYLLVFPSVIMALLMISFNLFGNGLRDAFNPSLKGAD